MKRYSLELPLNARRKLAEGAARRKKVSDEERLRRRAICAQCAERREDEGKIFCRLLASRCSHREAWASRCRCPTQQWGW